jgi:hypothetical protein
LFLILGLLLLFSFASFFIKMATIFLKHNLNFIFPEFLKYVFLTKIFLLHN